MGKLFNPENAGALPSFVGNAGKFLRVNTAENAVIFDGVNNNIALPFVANAATFHITDSGNFSIDLSGALTANGALTAVFDVLADAALVIFDNQTTGNFPVILNAAYTIPRGISLWYWNGVTLELIVHDGFTTAQVTPLPQATVISQAHYCGVVPRRVVMELVCVAADANYSIGDVIERPSVTSGGIYGYVCSPHKDAVNVGFALAAGQIFGIQNKTTGAWAVATAANWAYRFRIEL